MLGAPERACPPESARVLVVDDLPLMHRRVAKTLRAAIAGVLQRAT